MPLSITDVSQMQDMPVHVSVSSKVDAVQSDIHSFTMAISQPLNGVMNAHGKVRGVLGLNMNRSLVLPSCSTVITLSGELMACEEKVIQVAVECISTLSST